MAEVRELLIYEDGSHAMPATVVRENKTRKAQIMLESVSGNVVSYPGCSFSGGEIDSKKNLTFWNEAHRKAAMELRERHWDRPVQYVTKRDTSPPGLQKISSPILKAIKEDAKAKLDDLDEVEDADLIEEEEDCIEDVNDILKKEPSARILTDLVNGRRNDLVHQLFRDITDYSSTGALIWSKEFKPLTIFDPLPRRFYKQMNINRKVGKNFAFLPSECSSMQSLVHKDKIFRNIKENHEFYQRSRKEWEGKSPEEIYKDIMSKDTEVDLGDADSKPMALMMGFPASAAEKFTDHEQYRREELDNSPEDSRLLIYNEVEGTKIPKYAEEIRQYVNTPPEELAEKVPEGQRIRPPMPVRMAWHDNIDEAFKFMKNNIDANKEYEKATQRCGVNFSFEKEVLCKAMDALFLDEVKSTSGQLKRKRSDFSGS